MKKYSHKISLEPLERKLGQLLAALNDEDEIDLARIDKIARALLISLKTVEQMRVFKAEEEARKSNEDYVTFEKLKLPPRRERERMIKLMNLHFGVTSPADEEVSHEGGSHEDT